ncbi:MAG: FtsX-like permease family protein [Lachnospiraceae bacterium]|nr:FtsX-like permease family protein [Lachnospiraceae bacterium]
MNPFSAIYFVKENKKRCFLLIFMIFLSFGVYLGGLYVTNPLDNWKTTMDYYDKIVSVSNNSADGQDYQWFLHELESDGKVTILEMGTYNGFQWHSIMGFDNGICSFTFRSVEDFKIYCEHFGIECDFEQLKEQSMIMSEKFAKNKGFSIGDKVDKNGYSMIYSEFTLDAVTKEDGYTLYFITSEEDITSSATLLGNGMEGKELYDYVYSLQNQLEDKSNIYVYPGLREDIEGQFEIFNVIYIFIAILISIILAITIHAAFVGMYQRREFEFSVYRAIGISKKRIIGKIVSELLLLDLVALIIGAGITVLGIYLLNHLVLYPIGKYLCYYDSLALGALLLCNIISILPLMVTRCRQMLKTDICEY